MRQTRLASLTQTIMGLMSQIEIDRGLMFSQIDADLEVAIFEAIDTKNPASLNLIIKMLDDMNMEVSK